MVTGCDLAQIKEARKFSWLDLKLCGIFINGGLNFNFLRNIDVLLVRRINDLVNSLIQS